MKIRGDIIATINFNDYKYKDDFINNDKGIGYLNIRISSANSALPISNVKVIVFKYIDDDLIIFYEGYTDDSGSISNIELPTPLISNNNSLVPSYEEYNIEAIYNNTKMLYNIKMYSGIRVLQNINIIPRMEGI